MDSANALNNLQICLGGNYSRPWSMAHTKLHTVKHHSSHLKYQVTELYYSTSSATVKIEILFPLIYEFF